MRQTIPIHPVNGSHQSGNGRNDATPATSAPAVLGFRERAMEALKNFEEATCLPARLVMISETADLPPGNHCVCEEACSMSESAIGCLKWHALQRKSATDCREPVHEICQHGLFYAVAALRSRREVFGFVEFGPLSQDGKVNCKAAIKLSGPLVRELENEASLLLDAALNALPDQIRRAMDYILKNIEAPLDLDSVAKVASLSPAHFGRVFRRHTGRTVSQYVATRLVERACAMLKTSPHARISDIAMECGFESIPHFNRIFSRITGINPSRFRLMETALSPAGEPGGDEKVNQGRTAGGFSP